jgi:tetratricopeptide (TPR) repeat protein
LLKKALHLSRQMSNTAWTRKSLHGLGTAYQNWGDTSRAIDYFREYLEILDPETEWEEAREIWHTMGRLHRKAQQYHETYQIYHAFLEQAKAHGDDEAAAEAQLQIGDVYRRVEEAKKAVEAYKDALSLARDLKDREREAKALSGLGLAYYDMGRNWHAGRHLDKAVEQAEKTGDEALIAMTRYKLALVLYKQKKWTKALPHAEAARQLFRNLGADDMLQRVEGMLTAIGEQKERSTGFLLP